MRLIRAAAFSAVCVALSAAGHEMASGEGIPGWALLAGWLGVVPLAASLAGRERSLPGIATALLIGQLVLHALFSAGQWSEQTAPAAASPGAAGPAGTARLMGFAARLLCNDDLLHLTPADAEQIIRHAGIDPAAAISAGTPALPHGISGISAMSGMPSAASGAMPGGAMSMSLSMLFGHLVAALVAGVLLRRGEAELWRLIRLSAQGAAHVSALLPMHAVLAVLRSLPRIAVLLAERVVAARRRRAVERVHRTLESVVLQHSVIRRGPPALALAA